MKKIIYILLIFILLVSSASAAILTVPTQYKTIQSAVDSSSSGDTIYVKAGSYNELVTCNSKHLIFQGEKVDNCYKYPSVNGFYFNTCTQPFEAGSGDINGFTITGNGIIYAGVGNNTIRNNYINNCNIYFCGPVVSCNSVINNKFFNGGVMVSGSTENVIKGNTFYKSPVALSLKQCASCSTITGNTFNGCKVGVECWTIPSYLKGNTYKGNSVNIKTRVN